MKNNYTPEIRFPGFTEDWNQRRLPELMEFSNGINAPKESYGKGRKMISVMDVLADEPIIYENIRNSVEVNDTTESKNKVENGDLVFVRSSEIPDEVGWAKAYRQEKYALYSGFSIRGKKKSKFDAKFIELSLNYSNRKQIESKAGGSTRFNVSQSILSSIVILEPSIEEQIEIGNFFEKLEENIALHKQEITTLKQTKQGFLQKMFPKEGESVPEVRFPGFTGDWEERKLLNNIEKVLDFRGKSPTKFGMKWGKSGYLVLSALNVKNGYIDKQVEAKYGNQALFERWMGKERLEKGDVVFTTEAPLGNVAQVPDDNGYILNQRAVAFKTSIEKTDNNFLAQLLRSPLFQTKLKTNASGGTAKGIGMKEFAKMSATIPVSVDEQTKIGNFFKQLDETIALHQRELDALKETKKAFLQKMFV
ncbi:restriction endonuclease subunit S [Peribacillus frigoritolerans]|uniref:restriction endonuclease subunit S n=1 Tax=Peribacillus frigoritolerans TaxID=450367 RepID=UPI003D2B6C67